MTPASRESRIAGKAMCARYRDAPRGVMGSRRLGRQQLVVLALVFLGTAGVLVGADIHTVNWQKAQAPTVDSLLAAGGLRHVEGPDGEPDDAAWRQMRFMVFDLPGHGGSFDERIGAIDAAVRALGQPWVQAVAQRRVASDAALQALLQRTVRAGGEGLMLRRGASLYQAGRSDDLLKLKTHEDTEARVVAHLPGKGKHAGRLGALLVEMPSGQRFRLGAGFSDAERENPPPVGSWVTYRFRGRHDESGLPRFASFVRMREDMAPR